MHKLISSIVLIGTCLLLCFCNSAALSEVESRPHVVLLLFVANPWLTVIGSDSPVFVLYDDGTAIFVHMKDRSRYGANPYSSVKLSKMEETALLNSVSGIAKVKDRYSITNYKDQPTNIFLIKTSLLNKRIEIYGDLSNTGSSSFGVRKEVPERLLQLFDQLSNYENKNAKPWMPEYIEVMLSPFFECTEPGTVQWPYYNKWPSDWPDLTDSRTRKRSDSYSIYLPSINFDRLLELMELHKLGSFNLERPIELANKKWSIGYRFPFPDEQTIQDARRGQ